MKTLLQKIALLNVAATCVFSSLALPAGADSTADMVLSLRCRGGYGVQVWKDRSSDAFLYRATSHHGNLSLDGGTAQSTEGVRVYRFQNGNYQYWVWDGTLDSQDAGTLEVYENSRILMQQPCRKI
jgi:hypothetical protein